MRHTVNVWVISPVVIELDSDVSVEKPVVELLLEVEDEAGWVDSEVPLDISELCALDVDKLDVLVLLDASWSADDVAWGADVVPLDVAIDSELVSVLDWGDIVETLDVSVWELTALVVPVLTISAVVTDEEDSVESVDIPEDKHNVKFTVKNEEKCTKNINFWSS